MMPHVIRFNAQSVQNRYGELVHLMAEVSPSDRRNPSEILADRFTTWLRLASMATSLEELDSWKSKFANVEASKQPSPCDKEELLESMAQMAAKQWTGAFNPRPTKADDFLAIYRAATKV
jgi:alcohol dehydrogenase class IV